MTEQHMTCNFCKATSFQVRHLIKGIGAYICDECIMQCQEVIDEQKTIKFKKEINIDLTPKGIVEFLDQHVIGQNQAKRLLAVAVYNHYKRIGKKLDVEIQKSNILMIGPTGSGKTFLVSTLAKLFSVPFAVADATTLTEAGYVGQDVDQIISRLFLNAGGNVGRTERGIVYIDEIEKIARSDGNGRDVRGEGVQQALLKVIEGGIVAINPQGGKISPMAPSIDIDTTNILFIVGGAFNSLTDKHNLRKTMGFTPSVEVFPEITHKSLIKYGMIPEFVGRLPVIAQLHHLTENHLLDILTEPKNSIVKQYQVLFALDGTEIIFDKEFLQAVAKKAVSEGTGARGLRSIMEQVLSEVMFDAPTHKPKKLIINKSYISLVKEIVPEVLIGLVEGV